MGELVVGRPVLRQLFAVSAPLVLTSAISMTFRARLDGPEEASQAYDPHLFELRRRLRPELEHDLDLLLGFSGRLIYYTEELLFSFDALEPEKLDATYDEYYEHLVGLGPAAYQRMASNAVRRVYRDRGVFETPPESDDPAEWRMFLRPSITHADLDEAASLVSNPEELKRRTIALIDGFWREVYEEEYEAHLPDLQRAVRIAESHAHPVIQIAFSELTGHRLPDVIAGHLGDVERVTYCPSIHLNSYIQYIFYPPELILYFNPKIVLGMADARRQQFTDANGELSNDDALPGLKAVADPTRMKIIEMLRDREHYAQEIVGKLGISQSAVSRHLSTLESANVVTVRPAQGMKYYAINRDYLQSLAAYLGTLAGRNGN